ncbi:extracellular solute-binding protein [Eubacterium sp. 1001713B170207_170306_E7]|uniref:extracellular solute-binding protein n=1 Tax=Eubacterium sp. 1001713B170207_170306_E7 TaxID=2787097 RepID=UPI00189B2673|nr:extracellular solute-binding protein [Eubacterium sp. 1001713B170207_170306_E7]
MSKKKIGALLGAGLAVLLLAGVTGCSQQGKTDKIAVTMSYSEKAEHLEALIEETYPDIDFQWERVLSTSPSSDLRRQLSAGKAPDLVVSTQPADQESSQYLLPLDGYPFSTRYESTLIKSQSVDDTVYFLPFPGQYYGYVINQTLFEEAGIPLPQSNAELINALSQFKEKQIGLDDTGHVFGFRQKDDVTLGTFQVASMVPDFLGTAGGVQWMSDFTDNQAVMTGTWEPAFDLLTELTAKDLLSVDTYKKQGNSPNNALYMSDGRLVAAYGHSGFLEECRELNQQAVKDGTSREYTYSMLPFLSSGGNPSWTTALPAAYIGINAELGDETQKDKLDACCRILDLLSTQEGQEALIADTRTDDSYLKDYQNSQSVPSGLEETVQNGYVYNINFPGKITEYLGQQCAKFLSGAQTPQQCLAAVDEYYKNGSDTVDSDLEVVGSVAEDLIYQGYNTRLEETALGNLVADSVAEYADAPIAVVNGGGIRGSLYEGDVREADLKAVCPFDNQIVVVEMSGKVMQEMLENSLTTIRSSADVPGGRYLQVSGIKYTYDASKPEGQRLTEVTLADGKAVKADSTYTVAINNYMAGKNGYLEGNGDGNTMLNLYSDAQPKAEGVKMVKENLGTYRDALRHYFDNHQDKPVESAVEGRITNLSKESKQ